jgi:hypothetical protein
MSESAFKQFAKPQLRLFLYAGHDTTSSTLLYSYLLLSRHPVLLSKVRAEHDKVLGSDFSLDNITRTITNDPTLLNQLLLLRVKFAYDRDILSVTYNGHHGTPTTLGKIDYGIEIYLP